jgi:hypothetical protein
VGLTPVGMDMLVGMVSGAGTLSGWQPTTSNSIITRLKRLYILISFIQQIV